LLPNDGYDEEKNGFPFTGTKQGIETGAEILTAVNLDLLSGTQHREIC
jgi:hypothetical protein